MPRRKKRQETMTQDDILKQRLFEALKQSVRNPAEFSEGEAPLVLDPETDQTLEEGSSVYSVIADAEQAQEWPETPLSPELAESAERLRLELETVKVRAKSTLSATLTQESAHPEGTVAVSIHADLNTISLTNIDHDQTGGSMSDLTGYKDLSKAPLSYDDGPEPLSTFTVPNREDRATATLPHAPSFGDLGGDVDTEFSGNVKTLIRLVNELPDDVTKQTGAQIIRLTMEAMGISMEDVLSEAQSAQSEMLDAVRANIKKIEEYKTVIRKLETDIKYYQGKANELSEIIDLFILSNSHGDS